MNAGGGYWWLTLTVVPLSSKREKVGICTCRYYQGKSIIPDKIHSSFSWDFSGVFVIGLDFAPFFW